MKYESELLAEIIADRGHEKSFIHYESECREAFIEECKGSYPKLCDYESEWLNYMVENPIGEFPYETITDVTNATINNVVPFAFKSAILKGSTKYRDIDTGEVLEAFEDGRNLELVSVKMPVLMTTGKNLFDGKLKLAWGTVYAPTNFLQVQENKNYVISEANGRLKGATMYCFDENKNQVTSFDGTSKTIPIGVKYIKWYMSINDGVDVSDIKIQIEEGAVATSYEPYKSNILTVNEDVTLRGIGNVHDTLDLMTGEVTERIGEIVLDGSENWMLRSDKTNIIMFSVDNLPINTFKDYTKPENKMISNRFIAIYGDNQDINEFIMGRASGKGVIIGVFKNKVSNLIQFKEYLSQNNVVVQYCREKEAIETVDLTVVNQDGEPLSEIKPIEGTMHVEVSGTPINPTAVLEVPVEAITQNLNSFIEEE